MKRCNRISRKRFLELSRELHELARALGGELKVYYRPMNWFAVHHGIHRPYGHIYGMYAPFERKATVTVRGRVSRWSILGTMAHEVRHLQQHVGGLYADYFRQRDAVRLGTWASKHRLSRMPNVKRLDNTIAYFAEIDADRFAMKWMKSHSIDFNEKTFSYYLAEGGYSRTMAYQLNRDIDAKLIHIKIRETVGNRASEFITEKEELV